MASFAESKGGIHIKNRPANTAPVIVSTKDDINFQNGFVYYLKFTDMVFVEDKPRLEWVGIDTFERNKYARKAIEDRVLWQE